jgi:hypothetical protein
MREQYTYKPATDLFGNPYFQIYEDDKRICGCRNMADVKVVLKAYRNSAYQRERYKKKKELIQPKI